jgi:hypothetical protein
MIAAGGARTIAHGKGAPTPDGDTQRLEIIGRDDLDVEQRVVSLLVRRLPLGFQLPVVGHRTGKWMDEYGRHGAHAGSGRQSRQQTIE